VVGAVDNELAGSFTAFFEHCPVLRAESPEVRAGRLSEGRSKYTRRSSVISSAGEHVAVTSEGTPVGRRDNRKLPSNQHARVSVIRRTDLLGGETSEIGNVLSEQDVAGAATAKLGYGERQVRKG